MKVNSIEDVERFLAIQEQALGSNNPEVAITLQRLAALYLDAGDLLKAESIYERALSILEVSAAPHRAGAAAVGQKLYEISQQKREKEAAAARRGGTIPPHARRTLQDTPLTLSMGGIPSVDAYFAKMKSTNESHKPSVSATSEHEEVGLSTTDLSGKSEKPKKVTDSMIVEAQSEITLLRQMVGSKNVSVADALTKLADLYCRRKMYKEMEPLLIEALQIREETFGPEHHTVSTELKNLARVYMAQERYSIAEPLIKRAINIRTKSYGRHHRRTIDALELYMTLLRKTNRFEKADEIQKRLHDPNDTQGVGTDTSTEHDAYKFDRVR